MTKLFGTYRPKRISSPYNIDGNISLNGTYTLGFFLKNQFADYEQAGLTTILDQEIPEDNYTAELVPWVKKLTRFVVAEYNEQFIDGTEFMNSVKAVGAEFQVDVFTTPEEAVTWVKSNTNLQEVEAGKFLIRDAYTDPITQELVPAKYLTIA